MRTSLCAAAIAILFLTGAVDEARAQMFGSRSLGNSSLGPRPGPGSLGENSGTISGTERYLRGNRRRGAFIGTDSRDPRGFVGSLEGTATGNVAPTTVGLRTPPPITSSVNQPRTPRRQADMYDPKLEVGFEITPRDTKSVQVEIERHLREDSARDRFGQIEVSLEGETATMRGTVASANDRSVAEALVLFEPGVRTVRNQLVVRPPVPPTPPLPQE